MNRADFALPSDSLVPIRTISSLTGVNPVTLRAWERRYGLLKPVRTPKGHRLYSLSDIEMIRKVVELLDGGMSIGQVRKILKSSGSDSGDASAAGEGLDDVWNNYRARLIGAIETFDEFSASEVYNEILALYPIDVVTERLIIPLLQEIGWRWQRGDAGRVAEEHFFSVFLRNKLGARFHHRSRAADGPKLVAACLPGEQHDTGILLFGLAAQDWGYTVILLGANMPLDEIPKVIDRTGSRAVVLSGCAEPETELLQQSLPDLVGAVEVPVFVGGRVTARFRDPLAATGVDVLGSDFALAMSAINERLALHQSLSRP